MSEYDNIATTDDVLKLAAQRTGLTETESDSWRDGLAIILDDVNNSPAFTPYGRERILDDATNALGRRLQIHAYTQAHPEVLDAPVERPLIVLGMPRTGTTVISYLLDKDPARRSLLHWQCVHPVPPAPSDALRTDPRCLALLEEQRNILELVKQAKIALPHWEDADGPTEDMFIHNQDFKGLSWDSFLSTPRYYPMALRRSRHDEHLRVPEALSAGAAVNSARRLEPEDAVAFGAHRDAAQGVPRRAADLGASRPLQGDGIAGQPVEAAQGHGDDIRALDLEAMGRDAMGQMQYHVDRPLRARDRIGDDRFFHMYYHEMMRDPMEVMRRIYEWADEPLSAEAEAGMQQLARRASAGSVRPQHLQPRPIRPDASNNSSRSSPNTSTPSTSNSRQRHENVNGHRPG